MVALRMRRTDPALGTHHDPTEALFNGHRADDGAAKQAATIVTRAAQPASARELSRRLSAVGHAGTAPVAGLAAQGVDGAIRNGASAA
jgi:hypothetical protein